MRPIVIASLLLSTASSLAFAHPAAIAVTAGAVATGPRVVLTIAADGSIRIDSALVRGDAAITGKLKSAAANGKTEITIVCDKSTPYGELVRVIDLCNRAGLTQIFFAVAP